MLKLTSLRDNVNRRKRLWTALFVLFVLWVVPTAAFAGDTGRKTVKVGYIDSVNMMEGASDEDSKGGLAYEYLQKISYYTGWQYEYVYGDWNTILELFMKGDVDLMPDFSRTEEREAKALFPDYPMGTESYYIYVHVSDALFARGLDGLNGITVGVNRNTVQEQILDEWMKRTGIHFEVRTYSGEQERTAAFESGECNATVTTGYAVAPEDEVVPLVRIGGDDYYLGVTKGRDDLLAELNEAQEILMTIEPGYTQKLEDKFFEGSAVSRKLTKDEEEWLTQHPVIKVGYYEKYLPFSGTDADGKATGIVTDVFHEILSLLELDSRIAIEYTGYSSMDAMVEAVRNHEVDVIFPISNDMEMAEKEGILLTADVITTSMNLVYKGKYDASITDTIAVIKGNTLQLMYAKERYPDSEIVYYDTFIQALNAVEQGEVRSIIVNELRKDSFLSDSRYQNLRAIRMMDDSCRVMAAAGDQRELLLIINRGLTSLPEGFAVSATYQYMGRFVNYTFEDFLWDNLHAILIAAAVLVLAAFAVVLYVIISTRKQRLLNQMAHTDNMTQLQNRRAFDEYFEAHKEDVMTEEDLFASMDLNELKHMNDRFGHEAGDEMIVGTAECLKNVLSAYGTVYRVGGDEFVAPLKIKPERQREVMDLLQDRFRSWRGRKCPYLTVSLGYVVGSEKAEQTLGEMRREAERRMYEEKENYYSSVGHNRRRGV